MENKREISKLLWLAEDLLEQLINATECFDDPYSEEERKEAEQVINKIKEILNV